MNDEFDSLNVRLTRNYASATVPDGDCRAGGRSDSCPTLRLRSVVVEYDERPDRRTVYPEGLSSLERMSVWLTADDAAFVSLEDAR